MGEQLKTCSKCSSTKAETDFRPNAKLRDGLDSWCRTCTRGAVRESRAKYGDRYNATKRSGISERSGVRDALKADPECRGYLRVLKGDLCAYCLAPSTDFDHIVPVMAGGANTWDNFTAACRGCNNRKQGSSLLGFMLRVGLRDEWLETKARWESYATIGKAP